MKLLKIKNLIKMKIGIIWGSDSGDTEDTTMTMEGKLTSYDLEVINVAEASVEDFRKFDLLILGISTWYDGDLQSDWEDFFPEILKRLILLIKQ